MLRPPTMRKGFLKQPCATTIRCSSSSTNSCTAALKATFQAKTTPCPSAKPPCAAMMHSSLEAAEALAKEGIEAEVLDLRTLLPLDEETILQSVRKTNKCLVVHEDTKTGGIAGEIAAILCEKAFSDLDGPMMRVTALDTPVPYAPTLEEHFLPNAKKIFSAAKELARY